MDRFSWKKRNVDELVPGELQGHVSKVGLYLNAGTLLSHHRRWLADVIIR